MATSFLSPGTIDFRQLGANQTKNVLGAASSKNAFQLAPAPNYATKTYSDQFGLSFGPGGNANNGVKWDAASGQYMPGPISGNVGGGVNPNSNFTVLKQTKNPALANLQNAYTQQFQQNDNASQKQWGDYLKTLGSTQVNSANSYNQEQGAINNYFNGNVANDLTGMRNDYTNKSQNAINTLGTKLDTLGQNYQQNQNQNIQQFSGDLARNLGNWNTAGTANINNAGTSLNASTNNYNANAGGTINNEGQQLGGILNNYTGTGSSLNASATADLGAMRDQFTKDQNKKIQDEINSRKVLEDQYGDAARQQTELAIASADRARKAQQDVTGGSGDSSYFGRMAIGSRIGANADLASRLAALSNQDYGITRNEQIGLDSNVNGQARGDYNNIYGQNVALNQNAATMGSANARTTAAQQLQLAQDVANQQQNATRFTTGMNADLIGQVANRGFQNTQAVNAEQMNLGNQMFTTGRENASQISGDQLRLNEDAANRARSDYGFTSQSQIALLGQRAQAGDRLAAQQLQAILAGQQVQSNGIRNLGALGELDRANTFYGLDNGQPSSPTMYYAPNSGYRPGANRMAPQTGNVGVPYNGGAPNGAPSGGRPAVAPQLAVDQAYFKQTGFWPKQDPNYSEQLYTSLGGASEDTWRHPSSGQRFTGGGSYVGNPDTVPVGYNPNNWFDSNGGQDYSEYA